MITTRVGIAANPPLETRSKTGPSGARAGRSNMAIAAGVMMLGIIALSVAYLIQYQGVTPIREILSDPGHYRDSAVTVVGTVIDRFDSPLRYQPYKVADKSAELVVIVVGLPPNIGDRVRITGVVKVPPFGLIAPLLIEARHTHAHFPESFELRSEQ